MYESLKKIYLLLPRKDHLKFGLLFVMMIVASFFELVGIGLIPAFVISIAEPQKIFDLYIVGDLLLDYGIDNSQKLAFFGASLLIAAYIFKNIYLTYFQYLKQKFVLNKKLILQNRLFKAYMTAPYTFYLSKNSAELLRNVNGEVGKIITGTMLPLLDISLNTIMFLFIVVTLLVLEPVITIITVIMMGGGGYLFLKITQKKTEDSGRISRLASGDMNRMILQGLGGFKEARVLNRENLFLKQYNKFAKRGIGAHIYQTVVKSLPKPIIETLLVVGILTVTLIMVYEGRSFSEIIPVLTLFGVAAVKLMPIFNTFIQQITSIRYSADAVHAVYEDLNYLENNYPQFRESILSETDRMKLDHGISIQNVSYQYPESDEYAVKNVNLDIPKGSAVAFVGASGAGKTTMVDIILGLLEPVNGKILVDGVDISKNLRGWMKNIGYIQQSDYLFDERIFRNIAFGIPDDEINDEKLNNAINAAQLNELIKKMPNGLRTRVGERGIRLSGGQRQRVTIARALYNNPQVLVMDEATSALDNITEKFVIEAIERLRGDRTIIMIAHRLTTVKNCDVIYLMEEGEIVANGTYEELIEGNKQFRRMSLVDD
ncbi:ABC transporter ATP-binding protein [Rhodohalobacter sulfatireducens]|uniref:ABC transporter ATP-binding protein/permease n=1 Tax=Rhodohalobacter sulfatireducens TaxID=2911366 RepID=A0ABS9KIH3_9BACT|nr:ABC transporter ATP-binding protein [Rhodohalobacter sulfatireducens]MCG2590651.1 ABC transporter ATP-binding protein/permease [Rhodohalobacter sulfatireducens]